MKSIYLNLVLLLWQMISTGGDNVIDVDDILSEDFMPGALLVLENPKNLPPDHFNATLKQLESKVQVFDGSFGNAMDTMGFHRSMMNEYLCRNYVAEQIINDMTLSRMKRRMGVHSPDNKLSNIPNPVKPNLLADEGSSNYKDWLSKSATLEDIYRHYDHVHNRIQDREEEADKDDDVNEDYDSHITGYAYQHNSGGSPSKLGYNGGGGAYYGGGGYTYPSGGHVGGGGSSYSYGGHSGYGGGSGGGSGFSGHATGHGTGGGHSGYGGGGHVMHEAEHIVVEQPKYPQYHIYHESHSSKGHDLTDLFEIALTALAFLAFKTFLIHVLMCITMTSNNSTTVVSMMPMSMSPTATGMTMTGGGTGGDMPDTGGGMPDAGGGMTGTGMGDGTGGGMPDTGGGMTEPGGGMGDGGGGDGMGNGGTGGGTGDGGNDGGTGNGGTTAPTGNDGDGGTDEGAGGGTGDGTGMGDGGGDEATTGDGSAGTGVAADTASGTGMAATSTGTGAGGTGTGTGRDTERLRRDIPSTPSTNNQRLNELARRILTSIEAALVFNEDEGNCLRKTLCENNKFSRDLKDNNKILIPIWSLGMSWISGRLSKTVNPATSMFDSLKASVLGLGKANCEIVFQNCNLHEKRRERRKRKKRQAEM